MKTLPAMLKTFIIIDLETGEVSTQESTDRIFLAHLPYTYNIFAEIDTKDIEGIDKAKQSAKSCEHLQPMPSHLSPMVMNPVNCY